MLGRMAERIKISRTLYKLFALHKNSFKPKPGVLGWGARSFYRSIKLCGDEEAKRLG
jgi:hypothetical protein